MEGWEGERKGREGKGREGEREGEREGGSSLRARSLAAGIGGRLGWVGWGGAGLFKCTSIEKNSRIV